MIGLIERARARRVRRATARALDRLDDRMRRDMGLPERRIRRLSLPELLLLRP